MIHTKFKITRSFYRKKKCEAFFLGILFLWNFFKFYFSYYLKWSFIIQANKTETFRAYKNEALLIQYSFFAPNFVVLLLKEVVHIV